MRVTVVKDIGECPILPGTKHRSCCHIYFSSPFLIFPFKFYRGALKKQKKKKKKVSVLF